MLRFQINERSVVRNRIRRALIGAAGILVLTVVAGLLALPDITLAGKGGKGTTGKVGGDTSGWIFTMVTFDDLDAAGLPNGVVGDFDSNGDGVSDPYVDGQEMTEMRIGRNRGIHMDFNTSKNKPSIRTLLFPGGFPTPVLPNDPDCWPDLSSQDLVVTPPDPNAAAPTIALAAQDAGLGISGEDHDDTPVGCQRHVNARLMVKDDLGETWFVYFGSRVSAGGFLWAPCGSCMTVERLPNLDLDGDGIPDDPGKSQWMFWTEGIGYVYRDNNPPHAPTEFGGIVQLPMSGLIVSLTDETAPIVTDCTGLFLDRSGLDETDPCP